MKRRGFTLIELTVVLAAFLVLTAILFPIISEKREAERKRRNFHACQANIRQVGLAIKQYVSDHGESYPLVQVGPSPYGWADTVQPYARSAQLFQCPTEETLPAPGSNAVTANYTDYFYNSRLESKNESSFEYIATTIVLGDAAPGDARQHSTGGTSKIPGTASLVNRAGVPTGAALRHQKGAHYIFADGHIKWLKGLDSKTCRSIRNVASGASTAYPSFAVD